MNLICCIKQVPDTADVKIGPEIKGFPKRKSKKLSGKKSGKIFSCQKYCDFMVWHKECKMTVNIEDKLSLVQQPALPVLLPCQCLQA
jgi:hypothetical protein